MAQQGGFRGGVFISYRRDPAFEDATKLHGLLKARLGEHRVFFDQRAIPAGAGFPEEIETALRQAHLVLFVIAPGWAEEFHKREKVEGVDWVRREVQITQERRRDGMVNPPNVRVALVGGGKMPAAHELPDELGWLASINAYPPCNGDNWHLDQQWLDDFLADVDAAVPRETAPLDGPCLERLAAECSKGVLDRLTKWTSLKALKELQEHWRRAFSLPGAINPADALNEFRSVLESVNKNERATLASLGVGKLRDLKRRDLRNDCVAIVAELLRLGACRLVAKLPALGNHTTPIPATWLATQAFAAAHSQGGRKARISVEAGTPGAVNQFALERTMDQGTVSAGILKDQSSMILDQLWDMVPEFKDYQPTFPPNPRSPDDIADLTEALNSMSRDDQEARVTIALLGDSAEAAGAHMLRRWLVDMGLEIDVLVRTGKGTNDLGAKERELIGPTWRCLKQIEDISND